MLRLTFVLVLLPALFGISENVVAQSQSQSEGNKAVSRPQFETATLEELLAPENSDDSVTQLQSDKIKSIGRPQFEPSAVEVLLDSRYSDDINVRPLSDEIESIGRPQFESSTFKERLDPSNSKIVAAQFHSNENEFIGQPQLGPSTLDDLLDYSNSKIVVAKYQSEEIESIERPEPDTTTLEDLLDPKNTIDEENEDLDDDDNEDIGALRDDSDEDDDLDLDAEPGEERLTDERIRENWPKHTISEIDLSLAEVGRVPEDRSELLDDFGRIGPVSESVKVFAWVAPNIRYQPLYFEDVALERYGQTLKDYRQGIRSAILFGTQFTGWSLAMLEQKPKSCDHPLGFCRPGTCVPQTTQRHFFGAFSLRR